MPQSTDKVDEFIQLVVISFYKKAIDDFLIGYHFKHINDFTVHLPKICRFWRTQLEELSSIELKKLVSQGVPNNVINSHSYLKIKRGEVGRWVLLFNQNLDEQTPLWSGDHSLIEKWKRKVNQFEKKFLSSKQLFSD